jgi:hypothetical protein
MLKFEILLLTSRGFYLSATTCLGCLRSQLTSRLAAIKIGCRRLWTLRDPNGHSKLQKQIGLRGTIHRDLRRTFIQTPEYGCLSV